MFKTTLMAPTALAALGLTACGTSPAERGVTGAGIGAGVGLIGGPPGVLIGAAIGGTVGATTDEEDINLGPAPFDDDGKTTSDDTTMPSGPR